MDAELLAHVLPLPSLSPEAHTAIADAFEELTLHQGEFLFAQEQHRDAMSIVLEGEIELLAHMGETLQTMIIFQPPNIISARSLFDDKGIHQQSARVRSSVARVARITTARYQEIHARFPEVDRAFFSYILDIVDERLDHANRKLLSLVAAGNHAATAHTYEELGRLVSPTLVDTMRCKHFFLLQFFAQRWVLAWTNEPVGATTPSGSAFPNDALLDRMAATKESQWLTGDQARSLTHYSAEEIIAVPCLDNNDLVGAIIIGDRPGGHFSINTVLHMETVSAILAAAFRRLNQQNIARGQAELDQEYVLPFS